MIIEYQGIELSLGRAIERAPKGFKPAYDWFIDHEGRKGPRPWKEHAPADIPITLVAQRGIHMPAKSGYAISVTSTSNATYTADGVHELDDGTWTLQYCEHRRNSGATKGSEQYNQSLIRCLTDGLPVGVFIKTSNGSSDYVCKGLAFVERYDSSTQLFLLHGPINKKRNSHLYSFMDQAEMESFSEVLEHGEKEEALDFVAGYWNKSQDLLRVKAEIDSSPDADERSRTLVEMVRRKGQDDFRRKLIEAYGSECAITRYNAVGALQAAHITSYFGPKSQCVSNGILLRADLHLLYDSYQLAINPETMRVELSEQLKRTTYKELGNKELKLPKDKSLRPSEKRLFSKYSSFQQQQALLCENS